MPTKTSKQQDIQTESHQASNPLSPEELAAQEEAKAEAERKSRKEADWKRIQPLKDEYIRFFEQLPSQRAGADFIGRSVDTIQAWQRDDPEFKESVLRAKARWALKNSKRVRPDNVLANLYPDEFRPPKQEVESTVTTTEGQSAENLIAEAKRLGLDTSPYESLLTGTTDTGPSGEGQS